MEAQKKRHLWWAQTFQDTHKSARLTSQKSRNKIYRLCFVLVNYSLRCKARLCNCVCFPVQKWNFFVQLVKSSFLHGFFLGQRSVILPCHKGEDTGKLKWIQVRQKRKYQHMKKGKRWDVHFIFAPLTQKASDDSPCLLDSNLQRSWQWDILSFSKHRGN